MADKRDIETIRAFNRFYTRVIGLLGEGMYQSPHTLQEARVIHELGKRGTATAGVIAEELGMDRGQMSRLMWRLMDQGIIALLPRGPDKRSSPLALTQEGEAICRDLNLKSDEATARTLLEPFGRFEQVDLVSAMRRIETILAEPDRDEQLVLRPPRVGEIGWLIHRQALLYHFEQGWNAGFEHLITDVYAGFERSAGPKAIWIAEQNEQVAGSAFVLPAEDWSEGTAQLRMLYVEPSFRGRGLGRRLVEEAVRFARDAGYRRIVLWTQDCLVSARRIYEAAGFALVREEKHHSFGVDLNGQHWQKDL